jgi:DNA-directed RNA polymerase subunit M/transcription elongation factor TFIIS
MPKTPEFKCIKCGTQFQATVTESAKTCNCPECGKEYQIKWKPVSRSEYRHHNNPSLIDVGPTSDDFGSVPKEQIYSFTCPNCNTEHKIAKSLVKPIMACDMCGYALSPTIS